MSVKYICEGLAVSILSSKRQDGHKLGILKSYSSKHNSESLLEKFKYSPRPEIKVTFLTPSSLPTSPSQICIQYPVTHPALGFFILYSSCAQPLFATLLPPSDPSSLQISTVALK